MPNIIKRISCITLCLLILVMMSACADKAVWNAAAFDSKKLSQRLQNESVIASNENYELIWNVSNCTVSIKETDGDRVWGELAQIDGKPTVNELGMPVKRHPEVESAVIVEYLNPDTNLEEQALSYNSAVKDGRVYAEKIKNGVRVEYYFDDINVMIPVQYVLRENGVSVIK